MYWGKRCKGYTCIILRCKKVHTYTNHEAKYSTTVKSSPEAVQENSSRQGSELRHNTAIQLCGEDRKLAAKTAQQYGIGVYCH